MEENFLVVSSDSISNVEIKEYIGIVQGSTVRGRNIGADFLARMKNIVGGELVGYTSLLSKTREQALMRMIEDAKSKGGNAVVAFRYQTSTITEGASEILAFGTAVKI